MDKIKSFLKFEDYKITDLTFVLNKNFLGSDKTRLEISPDFSVEHIFSQDNKYVDVLISCEFFDENAFDENVPFYLKVSVTGTFTTDLQDNDEKTEAYEVMKINTISILFPYLRAAITNLTVHTNISPLILPPVNIHKLLS